MKAVSLLKLNVRSVLIALIAPVLLSWTTITDSRPTHSIRDDPPRKNHISLTMLGTKHAILRKRMNWIDGDIACYEKFGSHMAILETPEQLDELVKALFLISPWNGTKKDYHFVTSKYEFGLERRYWIGLSDNWGNVAEFVYKVPEVRKIEFSLPWPVDQDDGRKLKKGEEPPPRSAFNLSFAQNQPDHNYLIKRKRNKEKHIWEHCIGLWNPNYWRGDLHSLNDMPCDDQYYVICDTKPYQKRK